MKLALGLVAAISGLAVSAIVLAFFIIAPMTMDGKVSWEEATLGIVPAALASVVCAVLTIILFGRSKAMRSSAGVEGYGQKAEWNRYLRAAGLTLFGWLSLGVGVVFVMFSQVNTRLNFVDEWTAVGFSGVGLLLIIAGFFATLTGRRMSAPDAKQVLATDRRAPSIYLRAFDDEVRERRTLNRIAVLFSPIAAVHSFEGHMAGMMSNFGPFIAIGRPGERLPELGAARMYVGDDEWQSTVLDILSRCKAVVLRGGQTEGLRWELGEVVRNMNPRQVLVVVPRKAAQFDAFRQWANTILPTPLPDKIDGQFIMFADDWTPVVLNRQRTLKSWFRSFLAPFRAGVALNDTMAPFLSRLDQTEWNSFTERETRWFRRRRNIVAGVLVTVVSLFAGLMIWLQAELHDLHQKREQIRQLQQQHERELERLDGNNQ